MGDGFIMSIYTPHGLKIRLDPDRVDRVIAPIRENIDINDVYLDVELWANFPHAVSTFSAIIISVVMHSWFYTLLLFIIAFTIADLFQQFFYSRHLKSIFPQFLGAWMIALPVSIIVGIYLYRRGEVATGVIQLVLVLANWVKITDILLLLLTPLRVGLKKLPNYKFGAIELAFVQTLNSKASQLGVKLNWELYNFRET